jgi:hypothetical protein
MILLVIEVITAKTKESKSNNKKSKNNGNKKGSRNIRYDGSLATAP